MWDGLFVLIPFVYPQIYFLLLMQLLLGLSEEQMIASIVFLPFPTFHSLSRSGLWEGSYRIVQCKSNSGSVACGI